GVPPQGRRRASDKLAGAGHVLQQPAFRARKQFAITRKQAKCSGPILQGRQALHQPSKVILFPFHRGVTPAGDSREKVASWRLADSWCAYSTRDNRPRETPDRWPTLVGRGRRCEHLFTGRKRE